MFFSHLSQLMLSFFFLLPHSTVLASRIVDRFTSFYHASARCFVQVPEGFEEQSRNIPRDAFISLKDTVCKFDKLNRSFVIVLYETPGSPDQNGSYNGYIGKIQQHEQDIAYVLVRPDSLPLEPGKLSSPLLPADVTIISHQNKSSQQRHQLTHFLKLDICVYSYSIIVLFFMASVVFAFAETALVVERRLKRRPFVQMYQRTVLQVSTVLIGQEGLDPLTMTGRVICLSIDAFIFLLIYGILLNTVGADLVVSIAPPKINSLDDLLQSPLQPCIAKNMFMYELLKASPKQTKMHQVWLKTGASGKGVFTFDVVNYDYFTERINRVIDGVFDSQLAFILLNFIVDEIAKAAICMFSPTKAESFFKAQDLFASGHLSLLMSPKIHPYTGKVINYLTSIFWKLACSKDTGEAFSINYQSYFLKYTSTIARSSNVLKEEMIKRMDCPLILSQSTKCHLSSKVTFICY